MANKTMQITSELYNGRPVFLVNDCKHYANENNELVPVPLSDDEIKGQCVMTYAKDGKTWFEQVGTAKLTKRDDGTVVGIHQVKTGKNVEKYVVLWTTGNGKAFPKYKIPYGACKTAMAMAEQQAAE